MDSLHGILTRPVKLSILIYQTIAMLVNSFSPTTMERVRGVSGYTQTTTQTALLHLQRACPLVGLGPTHALRPMPLSWGTQAEPSALSQTIWVYVPEREIKVPVRTLVLGNFTLLPLVPLYTFIQSLLATDNYDELSSSLLQEQNAH